jgi:hypothetical protein
MYFSILFFIINYLFLISSVSTNLHHIHYYPILSISHSLIILDTIVLIILYFYDNFIIYLNTYP